jgi:DNA-binding CsgD family transcriptional regulator
MNPAQTGESAVAGFSGGRLHGRNAECQSLDQVIADVRAGRGRALILRGEAGAGKTALLDYLAGRASGEGCRVTRVPGARSETELAFAGLHRLCKPILGHAGRLPEPQRDALRLALGTAGGPPPDRLLLGLAVLGLLAEAAADGPLIWLIDDEQWLDRASAQALGFVARRLAPNPVALVFAARDPGAELAGLPELSIGRLKNNDARALLAAALAGPLDARVRDLIVAETRGNPLALLELPRQLSPAELAGGFGLPGAGPLGERAEDSLVYLLESLPAATRQLVRVAAADPSGDPSLVWRAAGLLGIPFYAGIPAEEAGLVQFGANVRFRHLSARSAAYRSASFAERRQVHRALAEATDPVTDPDRRAWHRAKATTGPDEEVAAELVRCTGAAQARGGLAAVAAFLERAAILTADPALRAERALDAARASLRAGAFSKTLELIAAAECGPLDELTGVRAELLRGQAAFASGLAGDASALLLKAAKRLEQLDAGLAREAYLEAWAAALSAGSLAAGGGLPEVSRAALDLAGPAAPRPPDVVLEGLARIVTEGPAAAAPALRRAVTTLMATDITAEESFRWGWLTPAAAIMAWDNAAWRVLLARQAERARETGALGQLPALLDALGIATAASGDLTAAADLAVEADAVRAVTGARTDRVAGMILASLRGQTAVAGRLIETAIAEAEACGRGLAVAHAHWAAAVLHNGLGRYEEALAAAGKAVEDSTARPAAMRALPELIEAAARAGRDGLARDALTRLAEVTRGCGGAAALGIEARCRALLGDDADKNYREAIDRLGGTELRPELARARLLYGEWLRRAGRRADAREQLRAAHEMLTAMGMAGFAERARRELLATGGLVRKHDVAGVAELTAQETLIARLAGDGASNPEIATQLFLSARTVEYHLRKVYCKLGIRSRRQLRPALARPAPARPAPARPAPARPELARPELAKPAPAKPELAGQPG